jgi:hypothetical protein
VRHCYRALPPYSCCNFCLCHVLRCDPRSLPPSRLVSAPESAQGGLRERRGHVRRQPRHGHLHIFPLCGVRSVSSGLGCECNHLCFSVHVATTARCSGSVANQQLIVPSV